MFGVSYVNTNILQQLNRATGMQIKPEGRERYSACLNPFIREFSPKNAFFNR